MSSYGKAQIVRLSLKELADIKMNQMCHELQKDICSVVDKMDNLGKAIAYSQESINQLILKEKEKRKELEKIDIEFNQIEEISKLIEMGYLEREAEWDTEKSTIIGRVKSIDYDSIITTLTYISKEYEYLILEK